MIPRKGTPTAPVRPAPCRPYLFVGQVPST